MMSARWQSVWALYAAFLPLFAVGAWAAEPSLAPCSGWLKREFAQPPTKMVKVKVLLAGDSLMEDLGPQMRRALRGYPSITFVPIGKKSTGLSRSDYYDWPSSLKKYLKSEKPEVVVMWVGTNDPQNIYGKTGLGRVGSEAWQEAYREKVREVLLPVVNAKARMILMGPPVVGDPKVNSQLAVISRIMKEECARYRKCGVTYVDMRLILGDAQGRYHATGKIPLTGKVAPLRTSDRVHITTAGNNLVMDYLLPYIGREIALHFGYLYDPSRRSSSSAVRIVPNRKR